MKNFKFLSLIIKSHDSYLPLKRIRIILYTSHNDQTKITEAQLLALVPGTTRPMVALEESAYPRLIVAASHTALSGDLGVLIIELPPPTEASTTTTTSTMASPTSTSVTTTIPTTPDDVDLDLDEDVDDEDFSVESSQVVTEDPYVLRWVALVGWKVVKAYIYAESISVIALSNKVPINVKRVW